MSNRVIIRAAAVLLALSGTACEPISEPWVSGAQAEALADERVRGADEKAVLRQRLERAGGAYQ